MTDTTPTTPASIPPSVRTSPSVWTNWVAQPVRWGVSDVAAGIALFASTILVAVIVVSAGLTPELESFSFVLAIAGYAALAGAVIFASYSRGQRSLAKDFGLSFRPVDLAIGLGIGIIAKLVSVVAAAVVIAVSGRSPESGNLVLSENMAWALLSGLLVTSLIAPFVEELFFRGLVLRTVRNIGVRLGGTRSAQVSAVVAAIVLNSLLFMVLHLWQSTDLVLIVILGTTTLLFGVLNSLVAIYTGRIAAPIIAHIFFNGSAVVTALLVS